MRMRRMFTFGGIACVIFGLQTSFSTAGTGPNLLQNTSFVAVMSNWALSGSPPMSVVTDIGHSDLTSMHFHAGIGTTTRSICSQGLAGKAGAYYKYSAWVKTQNVIGKSRIWVEWSGATGYLGGSYYEDTFSEPLQHGTSILAGEVAPDIKLRVTLDPSTGYSPSGVKAVAVLKEHEMGTGVETLSSSVWQDNAIEFTIPTGRVGLGTNRLDETSAFLDAVNARGLHAVYNICYGGPGYYLWSTLMPQLPQWPSQESFIRGCLRAFRTHPAVCALYLNDEGFGPDMLPLFKRNWQWAREEDPWHPTFTVQYNYFNSREYARATDSYGTDPYCLMYDTALAATSWKWARNGMSPEQPMWAVVQTFGNGYENCTPSDTREPTYDEMRCGSFCAVAEGATGIIFYNLHSMQRSPRFNERWAELTSIAAEIKALTPIIALPTANGAVSLVSGKASYRAKIKSIISCM